MFKNPLVSVVMTCFNHERYISDAILGIINQDYNNIELIVLDDGSTDESSSVIENLRRKFNFKFIIKCNEGLVETVNKGFQHATGDFVIFHDSDDISFPSRISQQVQALMRYSDCGYVTSNFIYADQDMNVFDIHCGDTRKNITYDFDDFMSGRAHSVIISSMFRRKALEAVMPLDRKYLSQDYQLFAYVTKAGYKCLVWEDDPVVAYRVHKKGLSKTRLPELMQAQLNMLEKYTDHPRYNDAIRMCKFQIMSAISDKSTLNAVRYALKNGVNPFEYSLLKGAIKIFTPSFLNKFLKKIYYKNFMIKIRLLRGIKFNSLDGGIRVFDTHYVKSLQHRLKKVKVQDKANNI